MQFCLLDLMSSHEHTLPKWAFLGHQITHNLHAQYVLLFLVLMVNFNRFRILCSTHSYSSRLFLCALEQGYG